MLVAKGVISTLGHFGYIPLSSFAVNIVVSLTLGAGTDYGIFLMGRYHEARQQRRKPGGRVLHRVPGCLARSSSARG